MSGEKGIFVVHEHHAKHHHFDFRLELDGVLKSWAIPKSIPLKSGIKRLAIEVEDHALEYADFEGRIPEGHYGAGEVRIWDRGEYEMESRKGYKMVFVLRGRKLKGKYVLLRFRKEDGKNLWLFFKSVSK